MSESVHRPTLAAALHHAATTRGDDIAYAFLSDGEEVSGSLTYRQLHDRACTIAAQLKALNADLQPVLVLCPAGLDYVASLFGCFYAGAIAVPAYPPTLRSGLARTVPRIRAIFEDCKARHVLTTKSVADVLTDEARLAAGLGAAGFILTDTLGEAPGPGPMPALAAPDALALLQYTSGSTSTPKGVLVNHRQLAANAAFIEQASALTPADRVLSWLPPYHDMGLIGGILQPAFTGCPCFLMPPDVFLRRPIRWLRSANRLGATTLLAPNFALDACVRRIAEADRAELDLSAVRVVCVGAEPVRAATLDRFSEAFAPSGFRRAALFPCYGMAEATLMITGGAAAAEPVVRAYVADDLKRNVARPAGHGDHAVTLVGCGQAGSGRLIIVDPESRREQGERQVGEIWVQSPSVASGYFRQPDATEASFRAFTAEHSGPMLRTGDLGFLDQGELFITGRLKDLIIIRGRNHYPQDIERSVQAIDDALVLDAGAAFAIELDGAEQLVVVQEVDKRTGADPTALLRRIPDAIRDAHDITPAAVVLIKRGGLAKTSSGKVQRRATREAYLADALDVVCSYRAPTRAETKSAEPPATPSSRTPSEAPRTSKRTLHIEAWLRDRVAVKLGVRADEIDARETMAHYGVDSALAAELIEELQEWLGVRLDTTISYDHPSIAGLSRALAAMTATGPSTIPAPPRATTMPAPDSSSRPTTPYATARRMSSYVPGTVEEPIAIVGMGCRFPGATDLTQFWTLLEGGGDAIGDVPKERWDAAALYDPEPGVPGKMCSKWGGFIPGLELFDAGFFNISPHEAARMDPQQRLFLEVTWEALEDACIAPQSLAGCRAGVFAGVCTSDFAALHGGDLSMIDADYGTGSAPSIVANRVSYFLDLKGPSETVDSACSSALVALKNAVRSLEQRECELAIVGGVNAVLAPDVGISFAQLGTLAKDGRCKAFDASADGFVRSEGAGAVVLKTLSQAEADGDRIYAVIQGVATNHDGRSNGLTSPSGAAQREVITRALERSGLDADALDYVEAQGAGTPIADAVELHALASVLATGTRETKLRIGSAKTNVGHLEAASGMVSLIKVALALHRELIPRQLHFTRAPDAVRLSELPIEIATQNAPWPRGARPRYAGVSAFGFGGSNAHVILGDPPEPVLRAKAPASAPHLLTLSARTDTALRESARRLADYVDRHPQAGIEEVCFSANAGRSSFGHRLALIAHDASELSKRLRDLSDRGESNGALSMRALPGARVAVGFAFTEAALDPDAVTALLTVHPVIRETFERDERTLREHLPQPLRAVLFEGTRHERAALLAQPLFAHAALASVQHALYELYRALGIEPEAVYGSGIGEYAAAAAAAALPWERALALATQRGALLESLVPGAQQRVTLRDTQRALEVLDGVVEAPSVTLVSAALGRAFGADDLPDAEHFSRVLLRTPGSFEAREAFLAEGCTIHLEIGPVSEAYRHAGPAGSAWLHTLRSTDARTDLLQNLAELFVRGAAIDWRALEGGQPRGKLSLPTYPFERSRHWLDFPRRARTSGAPERITTERPSTHPLVSRMRISRPAPGSGFFPAEVAERADPKKVSES